jgi:hypothetical protein
MAEAVHRLTIASIERSLQNLLGILGKAKAHAEANEFELDVLLQSRLYPDMYSLLQQLQYACYLPVDFAKHFTDKAAPHVGYDETTWDQCTKSIEETIAYLRSIDAGRLAKEAEKPVPIFFNDEMKLPAVDYAASVIMPDFHFHMTIAYAILRHNGVKLGKMDFLGKPD